MGAVFREPACQEQETTSFLKRGSAGTKTKHGATKTQEGFHGICPGCLETCVGALENKPVQKNGNA